MAYSKSLKMRMEDYYLIQSAIDWYVDEHPEEVKAYIAEGKYTPFALKWGIFKMSEVGVDGERIKGLLFVTRHLYKYLNDDHIDSAIRRMSIKEI